MTIVEKLQEAIGMTPTYTPEERAKVRAEAMDIAADVPWFSTILEHHIELEEAFANVKEAADESSRAEAQQILAFLLTAHANAEEAIVYPMMAIVGEASGAKHAYGEQAMAKMEMVKLDEIPVKMSKDYLEKLEEIRLAVAHHMMEEERDLFPTLAEKASDEQNEKLSVKYDEEFTNYAGEPDYEDDDAQDAA
ncbi:hypothetical protein sos41_15920 [Alphaproteobacteria bacterium SO-S41]|nr:hypothetical protein sos41_15920 [Alphaproteobacteria bacterium SO-S41]